MAGSTTFGLLQLSGATLALPLEQLREVTPMPERLLPLAVRSPICRGAIDLRGSAIPIIDLREPLGLPEGPAAADGVDRVGRVGRAIVAVVAHGAHLFGIAVDAAAGVVEIDDDHRQALHGGTDRCVTHTAQLDDGAIASLVDLDAVVALPGALSIDDHLRSDLVVRSGGFHHRRSLLLLRCGEHRLAIDTRIVRAVAPRVDRRPSNIRWPACRGIARHRGIDVPLVDPLRLVGLGAIDDGAADGVVVGFDDGDVILLATQVIDIASVDESAFGERPPVGLPDARWVEGFAEVDGRGQFLVLDATAVTTDADLVRVSRLNVDPAEVDGTTPVVSTNASLTGDGEVAGHPVERAAHHLRYTVGRAQVHAATVLTQVEEVSAAPVEMVRIDDGRGVLGLFEHRGQMLPLVCVATRLGLEPPDGAGGVVLHVSVDGHRAGLLVTSLQTIDAPTWVQDAPLRDGPLHVRFEPGTGLVRIVDLDALWHDLLVIDRELESLASVEPAAVGVGQLPPAGLG